eukprot:10587311-Heterocapsa_arctica.AAC.1
MLQGFFRPSWQSRMGMQPSRRAGSHQQAVHQQADRWGGISGEGTVEGFLVGTLEEALWRHWGGPSGKEAGQCAPKDSPLEEVNRGPSGLAIKGSCPHGGLQILLSIQTSRCVGANVSGHRVGKSDCWVMQHFWGRAGY